MTSSVSRRSLVLGITLAVGTVALTGCTSSHAPGDLGRLQQLLETCPDGQLVNSYNAIDGSGTSRDATIAAEHLKYLESKIERVAVCGGHLTVTAFGTNSVTAPIFEGDLSVPGATEIAKLRRVPAVVEEVMAEVARNYDPAIELLPEGGTDVTGLLRLFSEAHQLRPEMHLEATVLTDGLTNQGVVIDQVLTADEAATLADTVAVPDLSGSSLSVVGIGRVAGDPLPSSFIEGLKAFYTRLCSNTRADQCLVVTDGR